MFLTGHNPDYPEKILAAAQAQVRHRLARMQACRGVDVAEADIHLWQQCNPVVTEALVQLTWGGPQVLYNGGLQQARVRYYDADRRRPGLPASVAALVSSIDPQATALMPTLTALPRGTTSSTLPSKVWERPSPARRRPRPQAGCRLSGRRPSASPQRSRLSPTR